MLRKSITPKQAVRYLNDLLSADPAFMQSLFDASFRIDPKMVNHPTLHVTRLLDTKRNRTGLAHTDKAVYVASPLALLNGLFGVDKDARGAIGLVLELPSGKMKKFVCVSGRKKSRE